MAHYSQMEEDYFILSFFGHKPDGVLCDVGAADGISNSNTRALVDLGWHGVLIEPVASSCKSLMENCRGYPRVQVLHLAIGYPEGMHTMYVCTNCPSDAGTDPGEKSTLLPEEMDRWPMSQWRTIVTPVVNLCRVTPCGMEFLSIDAEGADFEVLRSLNMTVVQPKLIMIEHNQNRNRMLEKCNGYLAGYGYDRVFNNGLNAAWAKSEGEGVGRG